MKIQVFTNADEFDLIENKQFNANDIRGLQSFLYTLIVKLNIILQRLAL